jgi:hypothetical protein
MIASFKPTNLFQLSVAMNCLNFADFGLPVIVELIMPIIAPRYQPPSGYYKQESETTHLGQAMEVMEINHTEQAKMTGLMWKGRGLQSTAPRNNNNPQPGSRTFWVFRKDRN